MFHKLLRYIVMLVILTGFVPNASPAEAEKTTDIELRLAEDPTNVALLIAAGRTCLEEARKGDEPAMKKAEEYLGRALSLAPDSPQALVLHGSMLALKGRDAKLPVMKMRHVQNGLKEMDRAVELAPEDFSIRYQRGAYCLHLPDIFERAGTAVEDFEYLLSLAKQKPDSVSSEETTSIRLSLAQAKLMVGEVKEARALLETVKTGMPGTAYADKANAMLDKIDG